MTGPSVSVVVPCRNEEAFIARCIDSIQTQSHDDLEILVIDGESDDRTPDIVRQIAVGDNRVRLLTNPGRIVSTGLNIGLAAARGRWLVRVDAHCSVPTDYVARIVEHLRTGAWGGVGGRKNGVGLTPSGRAIAAAMASPVGVGNSTYHHGLETRTVEHIPFGAYPTEIARALGGWDAAVRVNQDFEFDHRVRQAGHQLLFDPEIVIDWHCRQSIADLYRQYRRYGRGKSQVVRLHPDSIRPRHLVPAAFVAGLATLALPFPPASARTAVRAGTAAAYGATIAYGIAKHGSESGGGRLPLRSRTLMVPAFLAMHLGQGVGFWHGLTVSAAANVSGMRRYGVGGLEARARRSASVNGGG